MEYSWNKVGIKMLYKIKTEIIDDYVVDVIENTLPDIKHKEVIKCRRLRTL